jgi:hypothetical protein
MITCFSNLVGIKNVTGYDSPTYDFVNSIAGITTTQLDSIRDQSENYDIDDAWLEIYNRATKSFYTDVQSRLKRYFKQYSLVDNVVTGYYRENTALAADNFLNGWYFDLNLESKNIAININSIFINQTNTGAFSLYVYDLSTNTLLDTISVISGTGLRSININKTYTSWKTPRIFIGYLETELTTIEADDLQLKYSGIARRARINNASAKVYQNISTNNNGTGLIVNFNIQCSLDNIICSRLAIFQEPFKYMVGVEFCNERIYSDRINRYTLMDREEAINLRTELKEHYDTILKAALDGLQVNENDMCFECSREINYRTLLP